MRFRGLRPGVEHGIALLLALEEFWIVLVDVVPFRQDARSSVDDLVAIAAVTGLCRPLPETDPVHFVLCGS